MARRRYLVAYDITEPKRLRRVCKTMEGFGDRLQYSVFVCDLRASELVALRWSIRDVANLAEDSIVIVDLGKAGDSRAFEFLGTRRPLPSQGPRVV